MWAYWIGGKDNFPADREAGDAVAAMFPLIRQVALADRAFLTRVVTFLAREAGIRQFLDVGTGLPAADNTHQVAQRITPTAKIVYVDNDPIVLAHARALLNGTAEGSTAYLDVDAHEPEEILRQASSTLDLAQPVGLLLLGLLCFLTDDAAAAATAATLREALAPGSYMAITHPTYDPAFNGEANRAAMAFWNENARPPITGRTFGQVADFFGDLDLLEPGLVSCTQWRPGGVEVGSTPPIVPQLGGVARKS